MVELVENRQEYWEFIRALRNEDGVKTGFIDQDNITEEQQIEYMWIHNNSYYILTENKEPVGYIGEINNDIRLAVLPSKQKMGYGRLMLNAFMLLRPDGHAKVLIDNVVSQRLFVSCGFACTSRDQKFFYYDLQVDQA